MTSASNHYHYHHRSTSPQTSISTPGFVSWSSCCNQDQNCPSPAPLWPPREMCWLKSANQLYTWKYHQKPQALLCLPLGVLDSGLDFILL